MSQARPPDDEQFSVRGKISFFETKTSTTNNEFTVKVRRHKSMQNLINRHWEPSQVLPASEEPRYNQQPRKIRNQDVNPKLNEIEDKVQEFKSNLEDYQDYSTKKHIVYRNQGTALLVDLTNVRTRSDAQVAKKSELVEVLKKLNQKLNTMLPTSRTRASAGDNGPTLLKRGGRDVAYSSVNDLRRLFEGAPSTKTTFNYTLNSQRGQSKVKDDNKRLSENLRPGDKEDGTGLRVEDKHYPKGDDALDDRSFQDELRSWTKTRKSWNSQKFKVEDDNKNDDANKRLDENLTSSDKEDKVSTVENEDLKRDNKNVVKNSDMLSVDDKPVKRKDQEAEVKNEGDLTTKNEDPEDEYIVNTDDASDESSATNSSDEDDGQNEDNLNNQNKENVDEASKIEDLNVKQEDDKNVVKNGDRKDEEVEVSNEGDLTTKNEEPEEDDDKKNQDNLNEQDNRFVGEYAKIENQGVLNVEQDTNNVDVLLIEDERRDSKDQEVDIKSDEAFGIEDKKSENDLIENEDNYENNDDKKEEEELSIDNNSNDKRDQENVKNGDDLNFEHIQGQEKYDKIFTDNRKDGENEVRRFEDRNIKDQNNDRRNEEDINVLHDENKTGVRNCKYVMMESKEFEEDNDDEDNKYSEEDSDDSLCGSTNSRTQADNHQDSEVVDTLDEDRFSEDSNTKVEDDDRSDDKDIDGENLDSEDQDDEDFDRQNEEKLNMTDEEFEELYKTNINSGDKEDLKLEDESEEDVEQEMNVEEEDYENLVDEDDVQAERRDNKLLDDKDEKNHEYLMEDKEFESATKDGYVDSDDSVSNKDHQENEQSEDYSREIEPDLNTEDKDDDEDLIAFDEDKGVDARNGEDSSNKDSDQVLDEEKKEFFIKYLPMEDKEFEEYNVNRVEENDSDSLSECSTTSPRDQDEQGRGEEEVPA